MRGVVLIDVESGVMVVMWVFWDENIIINVFVNGEWLLLLVEGMGLVLISIVGNELWLVKEKDIS